MVQGKFRVQQRGQVDLFTSKDFRSCVQRHEEAERAVPRRSIAEQWETLSYPSMGALVALFLGRVLDLFPA